MKSTKPTFKSIPAGTYEVIVDSCTSVESQKDNRPGIKFDFRIREDVEQPCKGRHIFKSFYVNDQGEFPEEKIGEFANACGIEDGKDFEPWELRLCTLRIVVREFTPDDKPDEKVTYVAYAKKSELEPLKTEAADFSDVTEDDIPFK